VLGAVAHPGNIEMREGDRLSLALARAGTSDLTSADLSRVRLTRFPPATGNTAPSFYEIDLYRVLQRGDQRYDVILRNGDRIFVPQIRVPHFNVIVPIVPTA
jgi:protein involved in polysaccharide export with SLBB domain